MNQAPARAGGPRRQDRFGRRTAGLLLAVGIFVMFFGLSGASTRPANVILATVGFVSLVSGAVLTRRLRPPLLLLA
jgi:hypothetical protein